jgi:hypothetical protein
MNFRALNDPSIEIRVFAKLPFIGIFARSACMVEFS